MIRPTQARAITPAVWVYPDQGRWSPRDNAAGGENRSQCRDSAFSRTGDTRRLCFACRQIFSATNRLWPIRPIPKAVPHAWVEPSTHGPATSRAGALFSKGGRYSCYPNPKQSSADRTRRPGGWLSVAAFAGGLKSDVSGAGATAIRTASSKRSYSSSLIALSWLESSGRSDRFLRIVIPPTLPMPHSGL